MLLRLLGDRGRYGPLLSPPLLHVVHFGCNILWRHLLGVKWAFEYYFVIKPMVQPSRALWYFAAHTRPNPNPDPNSQS